MEKARKMNDPAEDGNWVESCLKAIPDARITVFGDFCLDAYWLIDPDASELSVETNLPVRRVRQQRYSLGGAGNIAANLTALGAGRVRAVGLVGDDLFGRRLLELLNALGVDCRGMLLDQVDHANWQTLVYSKPCIGDVEQNRIDFGGFNVLSDETAEALQRQLRGAADESDVVILNQQVRSGVSTPLMIEIINSVVAEHPQCKFIVDSRHCAGSYKGCKLKLNSHEAERMLGHDAPADERIPAARATDSAAKIFDRTGATVFITRGENGLLVADDSGVHGVPGIQIIERVDPVGAGDALLAGVAAVLASGGDVIQAGTLGNIAASITVRKFQTTGTASPEEIRQVGPTPDYVYLPELADDPRRARHVDDSEIELVRDLPADISIRHAIFDHDGTISTLRVGWEQIMGPVMIRAILGPRYRDADEALYHKVVDATRAFIDKTTGVQTLVQMQGLVALVEQFGCVERSEILDIHGYKAIYNEALLAMVHARLAKLRNGELTPSDFQMKGARPLLEALRERGIKLYLASGTDEADVRAEAEALGYADLFEGRIFGATGDIKVEAKRIVLERIFREHNLSGSELATFGDGPVEIRETRKRGGVAVGLASDEVRRFGLNPTKRTRLIRAGADLVLPDFSQMGKLLAILTHDA